MFRIGEFAQLGRVSVKALRYYDEVSLLKPAEIDSFTGYRHYRPSQLSQLNRLLVFKDLGFSLSDIRELMRDEVSLEEMREMLQQKRTELEESVRGELSRLKRVEERLNRLERQKTTPPFDIVLRKVEPRLAASVRRKIPGYEQASGLFSELDAYLRGQGERGTHAAVWHRCACRHKTVDCEALGLLKRSIPSGRGVTVYEVPGDMMASLVHQGSDDTFDEAYIAMRSWIASNGMRITGPSREIYWLEESESESGGGVTEIQFPVSPKTRSSGSGQRRMRPGVSV